MNSSRKTAILVGVLFIVATVAGVVGGMLGSAFTAPSDAPDYLTNILADEGRVIALGFFTMIMGFAAVGIGVVMYPILKHQNETLALGFTAFRMIEGVLFAVSVASILSILAISRGFAEAGSPVASHFQTLGTLLKEGQAWAYQIGIISFGLAAPLFYYSLYRSKLIPRWLSGWGLVGCPLWMAACLLVLFGALSESSRLTTYLYLPIAVNEMVLAVWLIVKGFNPSAVAAE